MYLLLHTKSVKDGVENAVRALSNMAQTNMNLNMPVCSTVNDIERTAKMIHIYLVTGCMIASEFRAFFRLPKLCILTLNSPFYHQKKSTWSLYFFSLKILGKFLRNLPPEGYIVVFYTPTCKTCYTV